jgi:nitrogen fixation/metabolism regulation signal transduction histidine kinase
VTTNAARRATMPSLPPHVAKARTIRRYLLNPRFQLKYTGYLVVAVLSVMIGLGVVIWRTASASAVHATYAANQAEKALKESRTASHVVHTQSMMQAGENSELVKVLEEELKKTDREAEANVAEVRRQRDEVAEDTARLFYLLIGAGVGLLLLLTAIGVVITHRIVGPVFKIKRLIRQVASGRLVVNQRLRKGDELGDLFETFLQMTLSLKVLQLDRLATLEAAIKEAEASGASAATLERLRELEAQLRLPLA